MLFAIAVCFCLETCPNLPRSFFLSRWAQLGLSKGQGHTSPIVRPGMEFRVAWCFCKTISDHLIILTPACSKLDHMKHQPLLKNVKQQQLASLPFLPKFSQSVPVLERCPSYPLSKQNGFRLQDDCLRPGDSCPVICAELCPSRLRKEWGSTSRGWRCCGNTNWTGGIQHGVFYFHDATCLWLDCWIGIGPAPARVGSIHWHRGCGHLSWSDLHQGGSWCLRHCRPFLERLLPALRTLWRWRYPVCRCLELPPASCQDYGWCAKEVRDKLVDWQGGSLVSPAKLHDCFERDRLRQDDMSWVFPWDETIRSM